LEREVSTRSQPPIAEGGIVGVPVCMPDPPVDELWWGSKE
jgi:hypothetical protein